uniref:HTH La-type RNA-binding domain-containing protein n=1 Tax=Attheya septentrionalis TaxID=420275 RepID=A0A7S2UJJ9_9STRA|mmetsp:Transcript_28120/g.51216  ORF Transcript_28120/g.51216 Transcript_28120/m.51216 type:complete len:342 (+) Transcript_28120:329-1354(+)|eukprot:CAMPEP_0198281980 /NCGR_PEP_ID=MMETSP1449-20131203/1857_1 /TAXON_ID=420275 /ORGANISM="Attheya septentrionalis, Strain CCMP2084" /LENGTH=341 /DNA_ID=CAMNT_0043978025 /DNA_START=277 /DNA_END=1302 /DNA_ORIENTATION=+
MEVSRPQYSDVVKGQPTITPPTTSCTSPLPAPIHAVQAKSEGNRKLTTQNNSIVDPGEKEHKEADSGRSTATTESSSGRSSASTNSSEERDTIGDPSKNNNKPRGKLSQRRNRKRGKKKTKNQRLTDFTPHDLDRYLTCAVSQVEFFFSEDELSRNPFIRKNMDCEGYVPAALIFNFPSIASYSIPFNDLITAMIDKSDKLIVDTANETLQVKGDWKKWLYPNKEGGMGCPRWTKKEVETPGETRSKGNADKGTLQDDGKSSKIQQDESLESNSTVDGKELALLTFDTSSSSIDSNEVGKDDSSFLAASSSTNIKRLDDSTQDSTPGLTQCTQSDTDGESE